MGEARSDEAHVDDELTVTLIEQMRELGHDVEAEHFAALRSELAAARADAQTAAREAVDHLADAAHWEGEYDDATVALADARRALDTLVRAVDAECRAVERGDIKHALPVVIVLRHALAAASPSSPGTEGKG